MTKFASPLRYPGGKTRFAQRLSCRINKHFSAGDAITLVEPYAGGAGASLSLLFSGEVDHIIINDFDRTIFTFWQVAVSDTDYLINKIRRTSITIEEWNKQKQLYLYTKSNRKLAFATLFLNRTNRSGIIRGGPIGGMAQAGGWKIDARFTKSTLIKRLETIKSHRASISVTNEDGIKLIQRLERNKNNKRYFIFLDPPYFQKGNSLYLNHYNDDDHERLASLLEHSGLKKWLVTYNDVAYVRSLYAKMRIEKFLIHHNAYKSSVGKELIITPNAARI